jgi:hypothetical protein
VNLKAFSRDDWILGGIALLLAIDLLFLPWFSISASFGSFTATESLTATGSLSGWTAIIAALACVAIIVDIAVERLSPGTSVPNMGGSRTQTRWVLALVAVGFVALKFVLHVHFSYFGFAFYAAVVLCVALIAVARRANGAVGYRPRIR